MGDFFTAPPGYPDLPPDPQTPPPNFTQMGQGLGIGLQTTGALGGVLSSLFQILVAWFTWALGWILRLALQLAAWAISILGKVESDASVGYGAVVAATIKNLLGVTVDPALLGSRAGSDGRRAAALVMGKALINGLFSGVDVNSPGVVEPSADGVEGYLGNAMNIELNGWLESWFTDAVSYHLLEKYGDLKDGIVRIMGISRMSRQALQPLVKTFIHDPYQALINTNYRPKPIDEHTAMQAFLRQQINRDELSTILGEQGYSEAYIDQLYYQHLKYLPDAEVEYLLTRNIWTVTQANDYLQKQGWDSAYASFKIQIWQDKALQKYREKAVATATAAFVKGDLDAGSFQALINSSGLTDVENSWIIANANLERSLHITHLSRGDIETNILDGLMTFSDLEAWATRNGMPPNEEAILELQLLYKQTAKVASTVAKANAAKAKAQIAQQKAAAAAAKATQQKALAADKGVTVAEAETLVVDGLWTFDQLTAYLTAKQYGPDAITAIVALLHEKIAKTAAGTTAVAGVSAALKAKGLSLAQVQKAVLAGIMTVDQLNAYLENAGYTGPDAQVVSELTQEQLTAAQIKAAAKAAAAAAAHSKHINLPALERAVRLGLTPIASYNAALTTAGYDDMSITLLDGILNAQIAADAAAATKKAGTTVTSGAKQQTLAQIEQEVIQGVRPLTDYAQALTAAGYDPTDQMDLVNLAQIKIAARQHAQALHSDALGKAAKVGISLASAEAAVVGGINTIADYTAMLQQLGYDQVDVDTLVALLQAKVAAQAAKNA